MKPVKNLPTYALFLALVAVPAFAAIACGETKPPMTPDGTSDEAGASALPSTEGIPTSMPSMPSTSSVQLPGK